MTFDDTVNSLDEGQDKVYKEEVIEKLIFRNV